ncbi:hypothetical protein chiPu_0017488 [Chiloscyllium punctatum]|uniref:Nucleoporin Nup159/Nup146 N-terminal domain-containing protein n=1 Tax=Chiloscyllium punctatum TaxID=137246 RepID=A0A401RGF9_CHIPU|nr:hypothetical protein [Chiloscyllium punctatum]
MFKLHTVSHRRNFHFRQMKKVRIFDSPDELPKDRVNLLTLSNMYGLIFAGGKTGLKILNTQYLSLVDQSEGNINTIIEDPPVMTVNMKLPVHHIGLSCDDFTLSVAMTSEEYGLVIAFFDVRTFLNKLSHFLLAVLDICWISTYVFAVVYVAADGSLENPPELVMVSLAKKDEKREDQFLNFNDLCFGISTERQHHYYLHYFEYWDLILASSAASIEVSIVARQPDKVNWEVWVLEDAARAEFPVTDNSDDTMPVGIGVDITNQQAIIIGNEKTFPPSPILILLSTDGLLCPFYMLNSVPGMKTPVRSPVCPHIEGEREPKPAQVSIPAQSVLMPSHITTALPQESAVAMHPPASFRPSVLPVILPSFPNFPRVPAQTPHPKDMPTAEVKIELEEVSSSSDSQGPGASGAKLSSVPPAKFVRFLGSESSSETEWQQQMQQLLPSAAQGPPPGSIRSVLGATASFPVSKTCPTQSSASLELSVSDLEKQLKQHPVLDPVMMGIMEEISLFQKELDDLKARTARSNFEVGSAKEMTHLRYDAQSLHTFLLEVKEITETLHEEIGILKTMMLEGFAAVEDATTHNERNMDKNYLQLLRRKPLSPKNEAQLKEIRQLHQYVKFAVQDVNDVLDMEWEQYQEKNKKHNWDTELEMLRNVLVKTTLDGTPKGTSVTPGKLSPVKQSQLRNFLSKRQTPPVRSTAPANLSRSAFISPKCYGELEESSLKSTSLRLDYEGLQAKELKHAPVTRLPSFPPSAITAQSTPSGKGQPPTGPTATTIPKPTGKMVKPGAPAAEKPATSLPAAQAAAQAAFRRQMTSQVPAASASFPEPEQKEAPPTIAPQILPSTGLPPGPPSALSTSLSASETEIGTQVKQGPVKGPVKTESSPSGSSLPESSMSSSSLMASVSIASTSSLNALSNKAPGYLLGTKDAIRSSLKVPSKVSFGMGTDIPPSHRSSKSSSSSVSTSESAVTGVCPPNAVSSELQPAGTPVVNGTTPESAIPAAAGKPEDQQSSSESQPSKLESRIELYPPKTEVPLQPEPEILLQARPEVSPQPEVPQPQPRPEVAPPEPRPEVLPQPGPQVAPLEAGPEVAPPETRPEVAPLETRPEVAPLETRPEVAPLETRPEVAPLETRPEVAHLETRPEVAPLETRPKAALLETRPEAAPLETMPEVAPLEARPEVAPVEARPEVAPLPQTRPEVIPLQSEADVSEDSPKGVTIGSFSGLVVSQTDDACKLERCSQDNFVFAQTTKTSTASPSVSFGGVFQIGKSESAEEASVALVDTLVPRPSGTPYPSASAVGSRTSSSTSGAQSRGSKADFVSKQEEPISTAGQIAAAIAAINTLQDSSLASSLTSLSVSFTESTVLSSPDGKYTPLTSSLSTSSAAEKQAGTQSPKSLASKTSITFAGSPSLAGPSGTTSPSVSTSTSSQYVPGLIITPESRTSVGLTDRQPPLMDSVAAASSSLTTTEPQLGAPVIAPSVPAPVTTQPSSVSSLFGQPVGTSTPALGFGQLTTTAAPSTFVQGTNGMATPTIADNTSSTKAAFGQPSEPGVGQGQQQPASSSRFNFKQPTFGAPSSFPQPASTVPPVPGSASFPGVPTTSTATTFPFGQTTPGSSTIFGQSGTPTFGQNVSFGQAPAFGTSSAATSGFSFGQPPSFGSSAGSVFGQSTSGANVFGQRISRLYLVLEDMGLAFQALGPAEEGLEVVLDPQISPASHSPVDGGAEF